MKSLLGEVRLTFSEMNCTATLVLTLILTLGVYDGFCMLDDSKAYLEPGNQVKKVGDNVQFRCRSPAGYHSKYELSFIMEHNGTKIFEDGPEKTDERFSWAKFKLTSLKREHAGTYKCIIDAGGGENVTAESKLFVIEDDHRPIFVKEGDSSTVKCFNTISLGFVPYVECLWGDKKICHGEVSCNSCSIKAENEKDPKPITCKVTTKAAFDKNEKFDNESSAELKKAVSVVSWNACEEIPCTLKAHVFGLTKVNISWSMAGVNISSTEEESGSMLTSTTDPMNSTGVVLLTVSGRGAQQSWNISFGSVEDSQDVQPVLKAMIALGGIGIIVWIVRMIFYIFKTRNVHPCKIRKSESSEQHNDSAQVGSLSKEPSGDKGMEKRGEAEDVLSVNVGGVPLQDMTEGTKSEPRNEASEKTPLTAENNGGQPT